MLNKLFGRLSGESKRKGFTMTELLVVIGIIAIVCAIAIPAIISMNKSLKFKQANEYAESIFMAAQANLTEMRSDGQLINLLTDGNGAKQIPSDVDFPEDHVANYRYATSEDAVYDVLVPKMSVDSEVRDGNVLIEYNPFTGNVYAVFYKDGGETLSYGNVSRDEDARRDLLLGYYCGSALSTEPLTPEETEAEVNFINGEEGIVEVTIPVPRSYKSRVTDFANGIAVDLTIEGSTLTDDDRNGKSGSFTTQIKQAEDTDKNWKWVAAENKIIITYTLDSLMDKQSFANYCQLDGEPIKKATYAHVQARSASNETGTNNSLTTIKNESVFNIYPGENINISAEVTFQASSDKASVKISSGSFDNANPMFGTLVPMEGSDKYVLCVSNGRNLQNLNAIAPKIAEKIKTVVFTSDIDWNDTVTYYNGKASNGSYVNDSSEAPARSLPYFVPIHNENLFGTAQFVYPTEDSLANAIKGTLNDALDEVFKFFGKDNNFHFDLDANVPTLTDELDRKTDGNSYTNVVNDHATVSGNGHKIININIDASEYDLRGNFYAGNTQAIRDDDFVGVFGYVNTSIDGLSVVNPVIKGGDFSENNNPATGALVGAAGFNTLITNCSTYIDRSDDDYLAGLLPSSVAAQPAYDGAKSYGVKGSGAVGGLVGYAKSHRTVTEELGSDKSTLAFSDSFAAIPVSGHMRGNADKHYGYTNGVGGLVGNAEISNFYNCYASGDVKADGVYVTSLNGLYEATDNVANTLFELIGKDNRVDLFYNGRTSMGAGGFVGTSHGVRYTNCFASGDVLGTSSNTDNKAKKGAAGFVGIMSYEETLAYGNDTMADNKYKTDGKTEIAQQTVFQNCYAAGLAKMGANNSENFSGANARIKFDGFGGTATKYWSGSYYQVYAPWWYRENGTVVNGIERLPYESFIYKDSYYISQYVSETADQTNACAQPVTYDYLTDLTAMQNSDAWINGQIAAIKNRSIVSAVEDIKSLFGSSSDIKEEDYDANAFNYGGIYFGEWVNQNVQRKFTRIFAKDYNYNGPRYGTPTHTAEYGGIARLALDQSVRIAKIKNGDPGTFSPYDEWAEYNKSYYANTLDELEDIYKALYKDGFPASNWDAGKSGNATHSYDTVDNGAYPFSKLKGMDYYGRWASRSLACGLAYYEQYSDGSYGYYFDRDATSTLRNDKVVVSDGYAILTANIDDKIKVKIGDNEGVTLSSDGTQFKPTYSTDNSEYYVTRLPKSILDEASENITFADFYALMTANINGQDYTFYFNPNVALSQINPVDNGKADNENSKYNAEKPTALPESIYIRTARQLAALSSAGMQKTVTDSNAKFIQQIDINAETYTGMDCKANTPVEQFNASYSGRGYKEQASISGFENPIFKTIGANAKVSNLIVKCADTHNITDNEAGLLAGTNKGTVDNVDVSVAEDVKVNAGTTAGLLIGVNSGAVSNCDATISAAATVTAGTNAGGIIGVNIGTVEDCTANITAKTSVTATNAGGFVGAALEGSKFENVTVNGSDITGKDSVGAFAGYLEKTNASSVAVTVNGTVKATAADGTAAGFAASVKGGTITGSTVTIAKDAAVSAKSAAGLIGTANAADLSSLRLDLKGSVTGTDSAVGAVTKITGGSTKSVNVVLNGGTISAANNAAGFTLDAVTHIELCNVSGEGAISAANNAAGFAVSVSENDVFNCVVSPADHTKTNLKTAYSARTLAYLKISATGANGNAAGFAVSVSGAITSCSALGTISGTNAAGFAVNVENSGSINTSMANTDLSGGTGSPFAVTNTGLVANSYAWYKNGAAQVIDLNDEGQAAHYSSCYFAKLGSNEAKPVTVVKVGTVEQIGYDALAALDPKALGGESTVWQFAGKDDAYPFTDMGGAKYAYPMLHDHYGDWVNPTQYAYGVVYYEKSGDAIVSMNLVDLSVVTDTSAHPSYSLEKLAGDGTTITETGYAVFYAKENPTQIIIGGDGSVAAYEKLTVTKTDLAKLKAGGEPATTDQIDNFLETYEFSIWPKTKNAQTTQGIVINGLDGGKHMIVPAYADAIIKDWTAKSAAETMATYKIRTANQFANINADLGVASAAKGYEQTHSFTLSGNSDIETFKSLSYDGGGYEITVGAISHGLFGDVSGTDTAKTVIKNIKLTGAQLTAAKTAGIVADTVDEHSTITDVTLVKPRIEIEAAKYTKNTVAIGAVAGTNAGVITKINVETTKLVDADKNVIKDDNGKDMYIPFVIDASKTTLKAATKDVPALNLNIGGLVGSNEGTLTVSTVKTDIEFTPVTAAPEADAEKTALKQNVNFGGLAGYNTKTVKGDVTGDISLGSVALDNDGKDVTLTDDVKLGGLVGYSKSERDTKASVDGTVTGDISYTRPAVVSDDKDAEVKNKTVTDDVMLGGLVGYNHKGGTADASVTGTFNGKATKADEADKTIAIVKAEGENVSAPTKLSGTTYVGGLVGQMNGGSMSGGTASGAITVTGDETYVGGAIGYENGKATFNKVNTAVGINGSSWSAKPGNSVDCPSGYANIGKFVGYVTSGKFTDCSATGASDLRLQFLGSIHKTSDTVSGNIYTSNVKSDAMGGSVTSLDSGSFDFIGAVDSNKTAGFTKETDGTYYKFDAELNNCTYKSSKDGKVYTQYIENTKYFYTYAKVGDHTQYKPGETVKTFSNGDYFVVDNSGKNALTVDSKDIASTTFNSPVVDDKSTIWTYQDGSLYCNKAGATYKYLKMSSTLWTNLWSIKASEDSYIEWKLETSGNYVRFRHDWTAAWGKDGILYLYCDKEGKVSGSKINSDSSPSSDANFTIYRVISTPFENGTMTYKAYNRVCTSDEP